MLVGRITFWDESDTYVELYDDGTVTGTNEMMVRVIKAKLKASHYAEHPGAAYGDPWSWRLMTWTEELNEISPDVKAVYSIDPEYTRQRQLPDDQEVSI